MTTEVERADSTAPAVGGTQTQATAVEQSRAVAEVQAAVAVAQQFPRDVGRVAAEMRDACGRKSLADQAFYTVRNRGTGPSIHLAKELANIWGNLDYGVHELRRDDAAGMSEIRAYAWDQQRNVRNSRTFQVPHARMKDGERKPLTDLGDVYLNNQNIGSRAVRECIFNTVPRWFRDEAIAICRQTLENGEGEPLPERITKMIQAFGGYGIKLAQLERKIGSKRSAWTAADVADMGVLYASIKRGETTVDAEFAPERVTAAEITGQQHEDEPELPEQNFTGDADA